METEKLAVVSRKETALEYFKNVEHFWVPLEDFETLSGKTYDNIVVLVSDEEEADELIRKSIFKPNRIQFVILCDFIIITMILKNGEYEMQIHVLEDEKETLEYMLNTMV